VWVARRPFSIPAGATRTVAPLVPTATMRQLHARGRAVVMAVIALNGGRPSAFMRALTLARTR
jgi:hypothetical protein